jgi:hypothetical protein
VSSAILYGAIVVIWAGVLIPRWLRRESSTETSEAVADVETSAPVTEQERPVPGFAETAGPAQSDAPESPAPPGRDEERARVLAARRRLLGMLLALATGATALAVTQMAAWWVILPPAVMLLGYLALLREASKADAERRSAERTRTATPVTVADAAVPEAVPVTVPAPDAEVIDITGRVGEEFYDQYADAKLRAVGD